MPASADAGQFSCAAGQDERPGLAKIVCAFFFFSLPPLSRKTPSCMNTSRQATVYRSCDFPMLPRPRESSDIWVDWLGLYSCMQ